MIEKQRFIDVMSRNGLLEGRAEEDVHEFWDQAAAVAEEILPKLPPLGPLAFSRKNRIGQGELFPDVAVFVLNILRLSDAPFRKAITTFEHHVAEKLLTRADLADTPGGSFAAAYARMLYVTF